MEFGITKKLQQKAKVNGSLSVPSETELSFCWDVNYEIVRRKIMLYIMNTSSAFGVISYGLKPADIRDWQHTFESLLHAGMKDALHLSDEEVEAYFKMAGAPVLTKTHGRSSVATMNHLIYDAGWAGIEPDSAHGYQSELTNFTLSRITRTIQYHDKNDYPIVFDMVLKDIERIGLPCRESVLADIHQRSLNCW